MILSKDLYILGDDYLSANSRSRSQPNRTLASKTSKFNMKETTEVQTNFLSNHQAQNYHQSPINHHHHHHHHNHNHNHHQHHHHHHNHNHHNHHNHAHNNQQRPVELVFKNISVSVATKLSGSLASFDKLPQEKLILHDISGYAMPGQILSVMGPSGSGKTTLLSTLSGRLKPSCGCITLNGETLNKQLKRKICYVLQQDIFFTGLTLRQTLMYTAQLRLSDSLSYVEKKEHVEKIIDLLDLRHCQDTIIGDMMKRGLSGGEKKRANIACELLTNPTVMLIDEPTSGLDSSTAHNLMQTLKDYAVKEKKTIVATIHQPSSQMFYMFDKLLLLCNGRLAYFGDVNHVVRFFSNNGFEISPHYNPADFIMEIVKNIKCQEKIIDSAKELDKTPKNNQDDLDNNVFKQSSYKNHIDHMSDSKINNDESETWTNQNHHTDDSPTLGDFKSLELRVVIDQHDKKIQKIYNKIVCDDDSGRSSWSETDRSSTSTFSSNASYLHEICVSFSNSLNEKWPTCFWTQVKVLTQRNFYEAKNRMLSKLNWIQTIALAIVAGLIWFQVTRSGDWPPQSPIPNPQSPSPLLIKIICNSVYN